jgi:hypothetical protein
MVSLADGRGAGDGPIGMIGAGVGVAAGAGALCARAEPPHMTRNVAEMVKWRAEAARILRYMDACFHRFSAPKTELAIL